MTLPATLPRMPFPSFSCPLPILLYSSPANAPKRRKMQALKGLGGGVTASFLPGTTLGITELDLGNGMSIFDTPGLLVPSQVATIREKGREGGRER